MIKKHPRDGYSYKFSPDIKVQEVDSDVPAELLFGRLDEKMLIFSCFSSIIIFMKPYNYKYVLLYSNGVYKDNLNNKDCVWRFPSMETMRENCIKYSDEENFEIIEL